MCTVLVPRQYTSALETVHICMEVQEQALVAACAPGVRWLASAARSVADCAAAQVELVNGTAVALSGERAELGCAFEHIASSRCRGPRQCTSCHDGQRDGFA